MEKNVFETLSERGFIKQVTHEGLEEMLGREKVSFYIGFDPTADSLHVGHFVALMAMAHMQRAGHKPIVLLGGGTGMIGDPSGKTDMRKMMTTEMIDHNVAQFRKQIGKFLDFSQDKPNGAVMVDNGDWLRPLNYIDFLREVGAHFSVNRMLTAECYKRRMEKGLTFLEFNYMLMQAYDFLELNRRYGCKLEMGGDDQWSNILAGADLIRRKEQKEAYGLTFKLLLKSDGKKMGKTESGALWLDPEKTSPYEFFQYWRNVDDADVKNCRWTRWNGWVACRMRRSTRPRNALRSKSRGRYTAKRKRQRRWRRRVRCLPAVGRTRRCRRPRSRRRNWRKTSCCWTCSSRRVSPSPAARDGASFRAAASRSTGTKLRMNF